MVKIKMSLFCVLFCSQDPHFHKFQEKIFFSTIDTLSPWDGAINSVRSVKNAGERYNDRSLKILFLRTEFVPQSLKG